jgi:hypothetical protein
MKHDYSPTYNCFNCGIKDYRKSAIEIDLVFPSSRCEKVLVCYSCFRQVQNQKVFLIREGHGRHSKLEIPQEVKS